MKKLLIILLVILVAVTSLYLVYTKLLFKLSLTGAIRLNLPIVGSGKSGSSGGFWSGTGVNFRFTDISTGETKDFGRIEEGSIGYEVPFGLRLILNKTDYQSTAQFTVKKLQGGQSQNFTLKKGESVVFEGVRVEVVGYINSPCPPGAEC